MLRRWHLPVVDPVQLLQRASAQLRNLEELFARGDVPGQGLLGADFWRDLQEAATVATIAPAAIAPAGPSRTQAARPAAAPAAAYPQVDLYVTDSHVVANVALPGLQAAGDLAVAVDSGRLRLRGRTPAHPLQGAAQAPLAEQVHGPFDRVITLPVPVKGDTARSFYQNGLLEVWVERRSEA